MPTFERLADLTVTIEDYGLEALRRRVWGGFERQTTLVRLRGAGCEGVGEEVNYHAEEQRAFLGHGAAWPLAGRHRLGELEARLAEAELFPAAPRDPAARPYRTWAFVSAALDLALRQAGTGLAAWLGVEPRPVAFVVSPRLGEPPSAAPVLRLLEHDPAMRFKLDATSSWSPQLIAELAATRAVDCIDLKGAYRGTPVDQPPDAALYARIADAFSRAWLEDPAWTPPTRAALRGHESRVTWDAPIHGVEDVRSLGFPPRALNCKPSRFGTLQRLFDFYEFCRRRGIELYGGGQFELGPGRGQIQVLAALFHPAAPNDVAPVGYHDPQSPEGLPRSPLRPRLSARGFRWDDDVSR